MQRYYPYTNTAYNLILEYCSISRVRQYQQAYDAKKNGGNVLFDIRAHEKFVKTTMNFMYLEATQVAKNESFYERKDYVKLLLSISNDNRINHFAIEAIRMIEDFNLAVPNSAIPKNEAYEDYFKDCYILTDLLCKNTAYYLKKYFSNDVEQIEGVNKEIPVTQAVAPPKIKMKINVEQFAFLVRLMCESDLFEATQKTDVARLIIAHFSTAGADNIGETSMIKKLSETEKAEAIYWEKQLKKWRDKALKV